MGQMAIRLSTTTVLMAIALLGCKGVQPTSAASDVDGAAAVPIASSNAAGSSEGATRIEYITDPTLNNMRVMPIKIPASWTFKGVLVPKLPCTNDISEVFRATSPDGHSFAEVMPRVGWKWGNLPMDGTNSSQGCLPINAAMSAQDFLKNYSTTMQVEYVSDEPVPWQRGPVQTKVGVFTNAMANVRYRNGSVSMKGLMLVGLTCTHPQTGDGGRCTAVVTYVAAPENQFAAVRQLWSAPGMGRGNEMDEWVAAYSQRYANQLEASTRQLLNESNAAFAARQQMYKDAAAVQQQEHNEFLQTMQEGTDRSMANAAQIANSNHRSAQDMVDYSLDRQTVLDTTTGQAWKISNQVTPGGAVQKVHADGTPY
jgi:hypothetical protein